MSVPRSLRLARRLLPARYPPVGRRSNSTAADTGAAQDEPNEYQTIGLAIFDGCEVRQVPGYGRTLSHVVREGGPGLAALRRRRSAQDVRVEVSGRRRIRALDKGDIFEHGEEAGMIRPNAILRLADASFREYITDHAPRAGINVKTLQIREQTIAIPAQSQTPSPKGIIHYTVNGPRVLPIDIHSSLSSSPTRPDLISGEMHIFSGGGKGEYCGSCRIEYLLRCVEGEDSRPIEARGILEALNT